MHLQVKRAKARMFVDVEADDDDVCADNSIDVPAPSDDDFIDDRSKDDLSIVSSEAE